MQDILNRQRRRDRDGFSDSPAADEQSAPDGAKKTDRDYGTPQSTSREESAAPTKMVAHFKVTLTT